MATCNFVDKMVLTSIISIFIACIVCDLEGYMPEAVCCCLLVITQMAAIALEPLTTHPDEWAEPSHK